MSIYGQSAQSGMNSLQLMLTGANAGTDAAYNAAYAAQARKSNITKAMGVAQQNIAAFKQDTVTSNTEIQLQQLQAEAAAVVGAAAAGVEGGVLNDAVRATERNAGFAVGMVNAREDQLVESQLATIGSQSSALLTVQEPKISVVGDLLGFASSFELGDLQIAEALANRKPKESANDEFVGPQLWSG